MRQVKGLIVLAASILVITTLVIFGMRLIQRANGPTGSPLPNSIANVSTEPSGMVVVLNKPAERSKKHVLVNYIDQSGLALRTKQIPNATVDTAQFQVVQDDVFVYTEKGDEPGLRRMDEGGSLAAMANIQRGNSNDPSWLISPDGNFIAWSQTEYVAPNSVSTMYQAQVDGSHQKQVAQVNEPGEIYLRPFVWVKDEFGVWQIWYVRQAIGLGGYILFSDPTGPVFQKETTVVDQISSITDVSEDGSIVVFFDQTESGLTVHGSDFSLPLIGAGQAGEARLSPDHSTVAVAVASGNPEQESGWVELWSVGSQVSVRVMAEDTSQIIRVVDWLNDETVVLSVLKDNLYESDIFLVNKDGSFFRKVWTGYPIGVVPAP